VSEHGEKGGVGGDFRNMSSLREVKGGGERIGGRLTWLEEKKGVRSAWSETTRNSEGKKGILSKNPRGRGAGGLSHGVSNLLKQERGRSTKKGGEKSIIYIVVSGGAPKGETGGGGAPVKGQKEERG